MKHTLGELVIHPESYNSESCDLVIVNSPNDRIAITCPQTEEGVELANAKRLCLCWNCHDSLVEALKAMVADYEHLIQEDDGKPLEWRKNNISKASAILDRVKGEV